MTVYKRYNQEQLNNQYNNRLHVPDYADYFERWEKLSRQTEKEHTIIKNIFYGNHSEECLDIFPAKNPASKILIFIHGGYWHLLDKTLFHFLAATFLKHHVTTVLINYPLAPAASIDAIVSSCRKAIQWVHDNVMRFKGDLSQMYVMGHSAGAHLAAMLLVEDDTNFLKGVVALSGLFRLEPIMLSYVNNVLLMDMETAIRNSPVYLNPLNLSPLLLVTGTDETDEFKDQSMELYNSWKNKHNSIELLNISCKNHYSILDAVTEKGLSLQSAIFRLMNIMSDNFSVS
jgi:arylformamidase